MNQKPTTSLTIRQGGLMRRTRPRMHSFCLPKETTSALINFHCDDEPENDNAPAQEQPLPLNRRKMALQRNKQRMTSFRLPSHKTLLKAGSDVSDISSDDSDKSNAYDCEMDESEPATVTTPPPRADNRRVRALHNHKGLRQQSFRLPKETTKPLLRRSADDMESDDSDSDMNRRCQALRQHTRKMRLNSFCLPKETTKDLLHLMLDDESSEEEEPEEQPVVVVSDKSRRCQSLRQHTHKMRLRSFRLPKETTKDLLHFTAEQEGEEQALPRRVIRQSSFSARSA